MRQKGDTLIKLIPLLLTLAFVTYSIYIWVDRYQLKRTLHGIDHPEMWLPKRERQAHARKLLMRENDEYMDERIKKTMQDL